LTDQVEDVVERALLPAAAGKIVICTSTCDQDQLAALGARIEKQLRFLEAPVSGTSAQVRRGDGVGLIGGDAQIAQAAARVLDALFPRRFHMGKIGDGGRAKLAVNLILGLNRLALAEGLVFAARLGLDEVRFLDVARSTAAASQVMDTKGPKNGDARFCARSELGGTSSTKLPAPNGVCCGRCKRARTECERILFASLPVLSENPSPNSRPSCNDDFGSARADMPPKRPLLIGSPRTPL
jgi:hypothetical protein